MNTPHSSAALPPIMQTITRSVGWLGVAIWAALLPTLVMAPTMGLNLLWYLFIPLAPMLLFAAPNLWVSVCPISSMQTESERLLGLEPPKMPASTTRNLRMAGWVVLFVGVPTRHLWFNTIGAATLVACVVVTVFALGFGLRRQVLSGWCSGACPIRPVEVMYGQLTLDRRRPEPCSTCVGCVPSCARARPHFGGAELEREPLAGALALAFPGFVFAYFWLDGWVPCTGEHGDFTGLTHLAWIYGVMAAGGVTTWALGSAAQRLGVAPSTTFIAAAMAAYTAYYTGVIPELVIAWTLPALTRWILLLLPATVLIVAWTAWMRRAPVHFSPTAPTGR